MKCSLCGKETSGITLAVSIEPRAFYCWPCARKKMKEWLKTGGGR